MPTIFRDTVTVNGVEFNTLAASAAYPGSLQIGIDDLAGWRGTSEMDVTMTKIGYGDGETPSSRFPYRARYVDLQGWIFCEDRDIAESVMDEIILNAFPPNEDIELVRNERIPKSLTVRLAGRIETPQPVPEGFRFLVPLVAPDPFKYGLTDIGGVVGISGLSSGGLTFPIVFPVSFSGGEPSVSLTVVNEGNSPSPPTLTLSGPLGEGWRIENVDTAETIAFSVDLGESDTLVIDGRRETALLNGSSVAGKLVGDFWRLMPGPNQIKLFAEYNETATLTVSAKSSWRN